jgi:hypothetical protein
MAGIKPPGIKPPGIKTTGIKTPGGEAPGATKSSRGKLKMVTKPFRQRTALSNIKIRHEMAVVLTLPERGEFSFTAPAGLVQPVNACVNFS